MVVSFDVDRIRADFPILHQEVNGQPLVYLDNAATTQKPNAVIDAICDYYRNDNSNVHRGAHALADRATVKFEVARTKVAEFINAADTKQIIWTRGTTESINLVAASWGKANLKAGDRILVSAMEHHSNIVPWQLIAQATGAQAGIVTSGASAGLTLATAACLARWDVTRMAALPDTRGMPNQVLMARTHRNSYDHAIRLAGAHIVDIGHNDRGTGAGIRGLEPWEIEAAITPQTAAMVFVATAQTTDDLPAVLQVVQARGLPVIVDAAAQLPPRANLQRFIAAGADLVVYSGGKAIGGPQSSGILAGRRDLIGSALLQMMDMDVSPQTWSPAGLIDRRLLARLPSPTDGGWHASLKITAPLHQYPRRQPL